LPAAIVAWPLLARAQPLPVIGFMSGRAQEDSDYLVSAFREGLKEAGYEERVTSRSSFAGRAANTICCRARPSSW